MTRELDNVDIDGGSSAVREPADFVQLVRSDFAGSVPELWRQAVASHPDKTAVVDGEMRVSYGDLDDMAQRVATAIRERVDGGEDRVALLMKTGVELIAAIMGALEAGVVQVPLLPEESPARLSTILAHAQPSLVLTDAESAPVLEGVSGSLPVVRWSDLSSYPGTDLAPVAIDPLAPARILYTSGSTGEPKGVIWSQTQMIQYVSSNTSFIRLAPSDRVALLSSPAFAASTYPVFGALLEGATLCVYDVKQKGLTDLPSWMEIQGITVAKMIPTLFRRFAQALPPGQNLPALRTVMLGAEKILPGDVRLVGERFSSGTALICQLGATETGTISQWVVDPDVVDEEQSVPVGFLPDGVDLRLLDEEGHPVTPGQAGEIVVGGPQLALGYWRDAKLTEEAFISGPHGEGVLFRTRDLGRLRADGLLVHLGRKDLRIKIRGYGVDLAEVEAALVGLAGVREAVAEGRGDDRGEARLIGYVVTDDGMPLDALWAKEELASSLPDYMIPSLIVTLDDLPLNSRGKIDRSALPDPDDVSSAGRGDVAGPRTELEERLIEIWEQELGLAPIGVHDSFFDLGGASIQAYQVVARITRELGKHLAAPTLLTAPTIAELSEMIEAGGGGAAGSLVAFRETGSKAPWFCVHGRGGGVMFLRDLAPHMEPERPLYGLQPASRAEDVPAFRTVEQMASDYLAEIRAVQPEGPYFLGGSCFGGLVAREMARLLDENGERVAVLLVIDPPVTGLPKAPFVVRAWRALTFRIKKLRSRRMRGRFPDHIPERLHEIGADRYAYYREIHIRAGDQYRPGPSGVPIVILGSAGSTKQHLRMWRPISPGGVEVREFPGLHSDMFLPPRAPVMAAMIEEILARVQASL